MCRYRTCFKRSTKDKNSGHLDSTFFFTKQNFTFFPLTTWLGFLKYVVNTATKSFCASIELMPVAPMIGLRGWKKLWKAPQQFLGLNFYECFFKSVGPLWEQRYNIFNFRLLLGKPWKSVFPFRRAYETHGISNHQGITSSPRVEMKNYLYTCIFGCQGNKF